MYWLYIMMALFVVLLIAMIVGRDLMILRLNEEIEKYDEELILTEIEKTEFESYRVKDIAS